MATLRVEGLEALEEDLRKFGDRADEIGNAMLEAGAEELKESWKYHILKSGHVDSGSMVDSVKASKPKRNRDDGKYVEVFPHGKDKKGVRNAEKAYLLHYGWGDKTGDHFVDQVEKDAEEPVAEALENVLDEYLWQNVKM